MKCCCLQDGTRCQADIHACICIIPPAPCTYHHDANCKVHATDHYSMNWTRDAVRGTLRRRDVDERIFIVIQNQQHIFTKISLVTWTPKPGLVVCDVPLKGKPKNNTVISRWFHLLNWITHPKLMSETVILEDGEHLEIRFCSGQFANLRKRGFISRILSVYDEYFIPAVTRQTGLAVDGDEAICELCSDHLHDGQDIAIASCGHRFHYDELVEFSQDSNVCPTCDIKFKIGGSMPPF